MSDGNDVAPPRKTDILFRDDLPDCHNNACLNVCPWDNDQVGYSEGYRRAARLLVQYVNDTGQQQDFLVYPIIFLYRHHLELVLKALIRRAPFLMNRELTASEEDHLNKHRLDLLWTDLGPMLGQVFEDAGWDPLDPDDLEGIASHVEQISSLDQASFTFRYPQSRRGQRSLPPEVKCINLRNFAEMIERSASWLNSADMAMSRLEADKIEMLEQEHIDFA